MPLSDGVTIGIGDGANPEVFTTITKLQDIDGPGESAPTVAITDLSSTSEAFLRGLVDGGEVDLTGLMSPSAGSALISNGTTITIAGGAIAQVLSLQGPDQSAKFADTTHLGSSGRTYQRSSIEDGGTVAVEMILVDTDTSGQDVLHARLVDGASAAFVITLPDSTTVSFSAFITAYKPAVKMGEIIKASVTLKVTGAVTSPSLATGQAAVVTSMAAGTAVNYKITLTSSAGTITFSAYVARLRYGIAIDQAITLGIGLRLASKPTLSYA